MSTLSKIFSSVGLKRYLTSAIGAALAVASAIPGLDLVVVLLTKLNGALGVVGVSHAAATGSLAATLPGTIASIIAVALAVAAQVPALLPYVPLLQALAGIFGGATVVKGISSEK